MISWGERGTGPYCTQKFFDPQYCLIQMISWGVVVVVVFVVVVVVNHVCVYSHSSQCLRPDMTVMVDWA